MTLTQIASLLNTKIIPNVFGQGVDGSSNPITIAEDLRNVVDLGTALSNATAAQFKDFQNLLAVGVVETYCESRSYREETYGLFTNEIEYGGVIQRVKAKLLKASDSAILALDNAYNPAGGAGHEVDYTDGHFWGAQWDSKIFDKTDVFKVKWSISNEMFKKMFTDAKGVQKLVAMIEATVDNTIKLELNGLARGCLRKLIQSAYDGGRKIQLITAYNTKMGLTSSDPGFITLANWSQSTSFKLFCQTLMLELRSYITDYNEKYNDGTVPTFCPESDTRCILLTEFAAELDVALGSVYHKEMVEGVGTYQKINYWQNGTVDLLPYIASGSLHDQIVETIADSGTTTETIDHVVGVLFDSTACVITNSLDKTTSKYVPEEDFTTFFHHIARKYMIDTRNSAVVLLLS
ncbi:MAG: hypothetical protein IIY21_07355 [Clostridiales bacterium]|nr:hypothetical protein [Clostridiales bacterium]